MTTTPRKRITFTDSNMHNLVDLVVKYAAIVESKKTDAVTCKQKITAWDKLCNEYNSMVTESKTMEQLRTKFDNLKKETRRYFAKQRQLLYRTGGGQIENDIRDVLKNLYEKINAIINFSVQGLEAHCGDSDNIEIEASSCSGSNSGTSGEFTHNQNENSMEIIMEADHNDEILPLSNNSETMTTEIDLDCNILKRKKHPSLQMRKTKEKPTLEVLKEISTSKTELNKLKIELLRKEEIRNDELHKEKLEGLRLHNEEKRLKVELLQLKLQTLKQ